MARELAPKCKQCRRAAQKLFLKGERCNSSKCAMVKRNYIPGIHGPKFGSRGVRLTDYGTQLREKQKAKKSYRLLEKQFRNYYDKAIKQEGETGETFYKMLESRLDNVVFRSGFVSSKNLARQSVNHGHFQVNGKKVDIPSYQLKVNDKITIKKSSLTNKIFEGLGERLKNVDTPNWINIDGKELSITIVGAPDVKEAGPVFDLKAIIEYYSR
ncbi:30S ribosomal protein S4 [Candidatus Falkowbacteria bacterium]|jgi:small subunit ribosomal protein S4|nr:30S ribosomal protein S4 [Candidatus Falkowbacteria bacterium]